MTSIDELIAGLTDAQRKYLLAMVPNRPRTDAEPWILEVEREFSNRTHRKPLKGPGLATAHPLIRKGLVTRIPEPCECGWHFASLTPLGLEVQAALTQSKDTGR